MSLMMQLDLQKMKIVERLFVEYSISMGCIVEFWNLIWRKTTVDTHEGWEDPLLSMSIIVFVGVTMWTRRWTRRVE